MRASETEGVIMAEEEGEVALGSERGRSTIGFPYADLANAEQLVRAVYEHGRDCTVDQLAAWVSPPVNAQSGGFRSRVTAAQMFGLLERMRGRGRLGLTDLADRIFDPSTAADARVEAFMNVPLFAAVYDAYAGRRLPPAEALEQHIGQLGVAPKQVTRARQTLMGSAARAGFLHAEEGRLVTPARNGVPADEPSPEGGGPKESEPPPKTPLPLQDPMLRGLFERLPDAGSDWGKRARDHWIAAARTIFVLVYGPVEEDDIPAGASTPDAE